MFVLKIIEKFRKIKNGTFTCPFRGDWGPWEHKPNLDYWRPRGKDLCCNFCGSWKPEEFLEWCKTTDENSWMEVSDKRYKIYVTRPGIRNAEYGALYFKTHHLKDESQIPFINENIKRLKPNFEKMLNRFKDQK